MIALAARLASLALAAAAITATAPALAAPEPTGSAIVGHTDLDLSTADGVAKLNHRIKLAATKVCGTYHPGDLRQRANVHSCRAVALAGATRKVELAVAGARQGALAMNAAGKAPAIAIP